MFLLLCFLLFGVVCVLGGITLDETDLLLSSAVASSTVAAFGFVGFFLFTCKNDIARKVGYGLTTGAMIILLVCILPLIGQSSSPIVVVGLISFVFFGIYLLLKLIEQFMNKDFGPMNSQETYSRIQVILEWKKLLDDGIITKEEFEQKRIETLKIK